MGGNLTAAKKNATGPLLGNPLNGYLRIVEAWNLHSRKQLGVGPADGDQIGRIEVIDQCVEPLLFENVFAAGPAQCDVKDNWSRQFPDVLKEKVDGSRFLPLSGTPLCGDAPTGRIPCRPGR